MKAIDTYLNSLAAQFLNQTLLATRYLSWPPMQHLLGRRAKLASRINAYFRGLSTEQPTDLLADLAAMINEYHLIQRRALA